MIRNILLLFLLIIASVGSAVADELFSLKVGYASLDADGIFAANDGSIGTEIDFDNDLNFDDSENIYAQAALQFGRIRISAEYLPLDFSGNNTITRDISFGGQTFPAGTNVSSDVEMDVFDFAMAIHLLDIDDGPLRLQLGPEVAVKVADIDMSFRDTVSSAAESVSATVPVPTIGARGRIAFSDYAGVVGRIGYLEVSGNSFLDADIQLEFSPLPLLGIFAGYRYVDVDVDESDVVVNSTFSGPYAGVLARF
jgi:hypothetical protein